MSGTSAPEHHTTEGRDDGSPSSRHGRRSPSILGLSIVSGLNVISLAFLAYHFAGHPYEMAAPQAANELRVATTPLQKSEAVGTPETISGNIDLVPISKLVVSIASGFDITGGELADQRDGGPMIPTAAVQSGTTAPARPDTSSGHWVQLGALSKEATARRYWSGLKQRHATLLRGREPLYFGPMDVGGSLYHIRLGPMAGAAAARLCKELAADDADCFCVSPDNKRS